MIAPKPKPTSPSPSLRAERLTAGYGYGVVLRDVTFSVRPGEVVAVLGRNGVGKSTLVRALSGSTHVARGRVVLDGHDITGTSPHARARAGLCHIPDTGGVFRALTVGDNIRMFAAHTMRDGAERVRAVAPDLVRWWDRPAGALSGGYQQLLAIARAYLTPSRYVLLDEITTGLAPAVADNTYTLLGRLRDEGRGIVLVEHDVRRARAIADTVCVLDGGAVAFTGSPGDLDDDLLTRSYLGDRR